MNKLMIIAVAVASLTATQSFARPFHSGGFFGHDGPRGRHQNSENKDGVPMKKQTRTCYNIAGKPYQTTMAQCPIS